MILYWLKTFFGNESKAFRLLNATWVFDFFQIWFSNANSYKTGTENVVGWGQKLHKVTVSLPYSCRSVLLSPYPSSGASFSCGHVVKDEWQCTQGRTRSTYVESVATVGPGFLRSAWIVGLPKTTSLTSCTWSELSSNVFIGSPFQHRQSKRIKARSKGSQC